MLTYVIVGVVIFVILGVLIHFIYANWIDIELFFDDMHDFLDNTGFIADVDFRIPYKQFRQYYRIDPEKWTTHEFHVTYDKKYDIGFSVPGRIQYFFTMSRLEQEQAKIEFLQDLQEDLTERIGDIRKNTQEELDKIRKSIPKTESGTQDIERFFEAMKHDTESGGKH